MQLDFWPKAQVERSTWETVWNQVRDRPPAAPRVPWGCPLKISVVGCGLVFFLRLLGVLTPRARSRKQMACKAHAECSRAGYACPITIPHDRAALWIRTDVLCEPKHGFLKASVTCTLRACFDLAANCATFLRMGQWQSGRSEWQAERRYKTAVQRAKFSMPAA